MLNSVLMGVGVVVSVLLVLVELSWLIVLAALALDAALVLLALALDAALVLAARESGVLPALPV